jgi:F-box protein 1 (cyclin F)
MTIKEAAWMTDNTYTYEMVVTMIGETMAALKGNIIVCAVFICVIFF